MGNVERVLDANLNRAREALRVLEDHERFVRDAGGAAARLKALRHELAEVCRRGGLGAELVGSRESGADVGKETRAADQARAYADLGGLVTANCKRLEEALRSLEEFGRVRAAALGAAFGRLRFRAYEIEKELVVAGAAGGARGAFAGVRLYVIVTRAIAGRAAEVAARAALAGGADAIQLREKLLSDRGYLAVARRVRRVTERAGRLLIVNDRVDLALACGADGVHLGAEDLPLAEARRLLGAGRIVGVTCHTPAERRAAAAGGADYVSVGPVFASDTKFAHCGGGGAAVAGARVNAEASADAGADAGAPALRPVGLAAVREAVRAVAVPVVAIGGITPENVGRVARAGARCVAVCAGVIARPDVTAAARAIRAAVAARAGGRGREGA